MSSVLRERGVVCSVCSVNEHGRLLTRCSKMVGMLRLQLRFGKDGIFQFGKYDLEKEY